MEERFFTLTNWKHPYLVRKLAPLVNSKYLLKKGVKISISTVVNIHMWYDWPLFFFILSWDWVFPITEESTHLTIAQVVISERSRFTLYNNSLYQINIYSHLPLLFTPQLWDLPKKNNQRLHFSKLFPNKQKWRKHFLKIIHLYIKKLGVVKNVFQIS